VNSEYTFSKIYDSNCILFNNSYLSTKDVLLKPSTGILKSRKNANVSKTFLFNSPMDTVASFSLGDSLIETNQAYVGCRFFPKDLRLKELYLFQNSKNYWFTVGASQEDFDFIESWALKDKSRKLNICVDVAHGSTLFLHELYKKNIDLEDLIRNIKRQFPK